MSDNEKTYPDLAKVMADRDEFIEKYFLNQKPIVSLESKGYHDPNEDWVGVDAKNGVFIICDGVSSSVDASVASKIAGEFVMKKMAHIDKNLSKEEVEKFVAAAILEANKKLLKEAPKSETTFTFAYRWLDPGHGWLVTTASTGDSRAYMSDGPLMLEQLTVDDGMYRMPNNADLQKQIIQKLRNNNESKFGFKQSTTDDQIREASNRLNDVASTPEGRLNIQNELSKVDVNNPKTLQILKNKLSLQLAYAMRNLISKSLCEEDLTESDLKIKSYFAADGGTLVLTTDGIHDQLTLEQIEERVNNPFSSAEDLVAAALKVKGQQKKNDDLSAVVVRFPGKAIPMFIPYQGARWKVDDLNKDVVYLHKFPGNLSHAQIQDLFDREDEIQAADTIQVPLVNLYQDLKLDYPNPDEGIEFLRDLLGRPESNAMPLGKKILYPNYSAVVTSEGRRE